MFRASFRTFARTMPRRGFATSRAHVRHAFNNRPLVAFFGLSAGLLAFAATLPVSENATPDWNKIKAEIVAAIEADEEKRGDGTSMGPTLVRLAWHASGTYSIFDKTGGSSAASMRFAPESDWGANAGLKPARDFLETFKKKYPFLSYGDLWTLASVAAIEAMGGPKIPWRPGRRDADQKTLKTLPDGRLPNANMGCAHATNAHVRDIFGRMGFSDREIVALLGAHAIGRCHENASGFWGPWTNAETTFSNEYVTSVSMLVCLHDLTRSFLLL